MRDYMGIINKGGRWTPRAAALLLLLWLVVAAAPAAARWEGEEEKEAEGGSGKRHGRNIFVLQQTRHVVKTDAGEMKVVRSYRGRIIERPLHIGFITMEPRSLFIPQYLDSSLILFIRRGEARIGSIQQDELVERHLMAGHLYRIPAGSAFYLLNTAEGQRLHIICSFDPSESLGLDSAIHSFFVGGGINPTSILQGFSPRTLSAAFNASVGEVKEIMSRQQDGGIVYIDRSPNIWAHFLKLNEEERLQHLKKMLPFGPNEEEDEAYEEKQQQQQQPIRWSWRKLLNPLASQEKNKKRSWTGAPNPYNIYDKKPDFRNDYGWTVALDHSDYSPLKKSGIGIFLVNLTAGSMMVPHVNPTATEYAVVLSGSGTIQVVYPNGTGTEARVKEGDVFWVPKFFPFCQIASGTGPLEFLGFTTSSQENRPQFLVGAYSLLNQMRGPEIAASFGVSEERFRRVAGAQREAVIVPSTYAAPGDGEDRQPPAVEKKTERAAEGDADGIRLKKVS